MRPVIGILFGAFLLLSSSSCQLTVEKELVIGEWKGVEWLIEGQEGDYDATSTFFEFSEDGRYTYMYGDVGEQGIYTVVNNELFTTPDGGMKMMVRIKKLTPDTMVLGMNRGGTSETLTLAKK